MRRPVLAFLAACLSLAAPARAQGFDNPEAVAEWTRRLDTGRTVADRMVVCFDAGSFLAEISRWDAGTHWPVLLWDSDLVPKFAAAFGPKEVLFAEPSGDADPALDAGIDAVARSWGLAAGSPSGAKALLAALKERGRTPNGVVLLSAGSPDLLGGIAVAAGRMQLPLVFETQEGRDKPVSEERVIEIRDRLEAAVAALGVDYDRKLDELDFVTVASDLPFAYTRQGAGIHPGRYTVDDALARHAGHGRWGWVGRLTGGPARSVHMAMSALFLQPGGGLLWSRYDPRNETFGQFDTLPALDTFRALFPTETIRHPDATLVRWRKEQWPAGNRHGLLLVNSSGGATDWSMSGGGATFLDVPDTVPCVVHYTHSGSAGRPFDTDTIAGRWLVGGAYVYFGSHAEPYLHAFIPPRELARRVELGVPLGAAMRHLYDPRLVGQRKMKVGDEEQTVSIDVTAPWKLAYFGDPSYRLLLERPQRVAPPPAAKDRFTLAELRKRRSKAVPATDSLGLVLLDGPDAETVDARLWSKLVKSDVDGEALHREMLRLWVASLRRQKAALLADPKELARVLDPPAPLRALTKRGAASTDGARLVTEFAKEFVASVGADPGSAVGRAPGSALPVLAAAASFAPSKGSVKALHSWLCEAARSLGVAPDDLRREVLSRDWVPEAVRTAVESEVKGGL